MILIKIFYVDIHPMVIREHFCAALPSDVVTGRRHEQDNEYISMQSRYFVQDPSTSQVFAHPKNDVPPSSCTNPAKATQTNAMHSPAESRCESFLPVGFADLASQEWQG